MKLIRGAPGTGKTAHVLREFKAALRTGAVNLRIVVPTATLVRHLQHELARDGVVFSPRSVVSLKRFVADAAPLPLVPDGLLNAIVRDNLQRLTFPEFAAVASTEGMAATLVETLTLFENAGATPDRIASIRKLGAHAEPFEKLWRAVRENVTRSGHQMRGDWLRTAAANLAPARIWLDGFVAFSAIEQEFIRVLARSCDVTLTITDGPASDDTRRFALQLGAEDRLLPGVSRKPCRAHLSARSMEREADEIAHRIVSLRDRGTEFREIGVALREAGAYLPLLRGTFDRFGIPARFYFGSPLRKHPAAIFLGGLITGALEGFNFETTLHTLRHHPGWGTHADFDRFDFDVRKAMPGHGTAALLSLCETPWLKDEIDACLKVEAWTALQQNPGEWQRRFEAMANALYRAGQLEPPRDHTGIEAARSHVAAVRAWAEAVASVTAFWADPSAPVPLSEFWRVASIAVDTAVLHPVDDRANVVHVVSVKEARQWDVATLFVCGMTDRDFPRQHSQNLLFPDSDIERLHAAGIPLLKAGDQEREERWLYESLCSRAAASLFLSYPEHEAAGKSVQRSRFLAPEIVAEPALLCRAEAQVDAASPAHAGRIASPFLQTEIARLHKTISLTSVEDLAQCRFKFFSAKTLGLKAAPDRPDERLNPRVTGSILHVALERWLADKGRDFVELFEQAFDETCRAEHLQPGFRLEVERLRFREIAQRVSANDLWVPDSSEAEKALSFDLNGVTITCRIDRIDRFGDDCVIVDYKSSKTANVEKLVASSTRLQGPLYAYAVRENMHLNPVAMFYWAVREDERFGWGKIPGHDLKPEFKPMPANWADDAKARTLERLAGFLAGQVQAHPEEADHCRWCDFAAACRVEQPAFVVIEHAAGGAASA